MLVSLLVFESSDLKATWTSYMEGYEKLLASESSPLPRALGLQPFGIELPTLGKVFAVGATWTSDDHDAGRQWFAKVASLGTCLLNKPEPRSVAAYTAINEALVTYGSYGRCYTLNLARYTPKTAVVLAKHTARIPSGGGIALSLHALRAPASGEASVFGARVPHHMLELVTTTPVPELEIPAAKWARELLADLRESDPDNVLESSYVSLVGDGDTDYRKIYGSNYDTLVALKNKYDPGNVFKYAVPRLLA